jgi:hypothetical protein
MPSVLRKVGAGIAAAAAAPVVGVARGSKELIVDAFKTTARSVNPFAIIGAALGGVPGGGVITDSFKDVYQKLIGNSEKIAKAQRAVGAVEETKKGLEGLFEETKKNNKLMAKLVDVVIKMIRGTSESRFRKIETERETKRKERMSFWQRDKEGRLKRGMFGGLRRVKPQEGLVSGLLNGITMRTRWIILGTGAFLLFLKKNAKDLVTGLTKFVGGVYVQLTKWFTKAKTVLSTAINASARLAAKGTGATVRGAQSLAKRIGRGAKGVVKAAPGFLKGTKELLKSPGAKLAGRMLGGVGWAWLSYDVAKELKEGSTMRDTLGEGKGFDAPKLADPNAVVPQREGIHNMFNDSMDKFMEREQAKPQVEGSLKSTLPPAASIENTTISNVYNTMVDSYKKRPVMIYNDNSVTERVAARPAQDLSREKTERRAKASTQRPVNRYEFS